jgi:hypothetical protein
LLTRAMFRPISQSVMPKARMVAAPWMASFTFDSTGDLMQQQQQQQQEDGCSGENPQTSVSADMDSVCACITAGSAPSKVGVKSHASDYGLSSSTHVRRAPP